MKTLWIDTGSGRRPGGKLSDDGTLFKRVSRKVHLNRALNAWGFDAGMLDELADEVKRLEVEDTDSGVTYAIGVEEFVERAVWRDGMYLVAVKWWGKGED